MVEVVYQSAIFRVRAIPTFLSLLFFLIHFSSDYLPIPYQHNYHLFIFFYKLNSQLQLLYFSIFIRSLYQLLKVVVPYKAKPSKEILPLKKIHFRLDHNVANNTLMITKKIQFQQMQSAND